MSDTTRTRPAAKSSRMSAALGLPNLKGNEKFLAANLIDSLGNGTMLAFQIAFFIMTTDLNAAQVGGAVTAARLISLPAPVLIGPVMDRFGARTVMTGGNVISAIAFVGFLAADQIWSVIATGLLVQVGSSMFWTAQGALVGLAAQGADRTRWFGLIRVLRNIGLGAGGALAAAALAIGGPSGLTWLVVLNAVSFAVAAWLIHTWRVSDRSPGPTAQAGTDGTEGGSGREAATYADVLRDSRYLTLVAANLAFVLASMVLSILLTVYVVEALDEGAWLGGVLLLINTLAVIFTQTIVTKRTERARPVTVLATAAAVNAVAFVAFSLVGAAPDGLVLAGLVAATLIFTLGEMLSAPSMSELSVTLASEAARGRYLGLFQLSWGVGMAIAPVMFMTLFDVSSTLPWLVLAGLMLVTIPLLLMLGKDRSHV